MAPVFAPQHVANIKTMAREHYFDGLAVIRSQDNWVVQWGDPDEKNPRPLKSAKAKLDGEFTVPLKNDTSFTRLPDRDGYAAQVGHSNGFPVGHDPKTGRAWLTHCYGMVGVARGNESDSGNGSSLYVLNAGPSGGMMVEGNVGIGSLTPGQKIDVNGAGRFFGTGDTQLNTTAGNVGIGTTLETSLLSVGGGVSIGATYTNSANKLMTVNTTSGNVGIGTSSAQTLLTVLGGNVGIGTWTSGAALNVYGGNVGIGTVASPTALWVQGTGTFTTGVNIGIGTGSATRVCMKNNQMVMCN